MRTCDHCHYLRAKTKIGILPIEIEQEKESYHITMTQGRFVQKSISSEAEASLLAALGLTKEDMDTRCPIKIASTGHSKVMIGIKHRKQLNNLTPNENQLTELSKEINCNGYFVFTFDSNKKDILTFGRMFAPAIGIKEDPVTGNANGPLGGYLIENSIIEAPTDVFEFIGAQGGDIIQGGFVTTMLDAVCSFSVFGTNPNVIKLATLELKVTYLKASRAGKFKAIGKIESMGRSIAFLTGELYNETGEKTATITTTAKIKLK